ncbi:MAG TPA: M20/M25/M40 family metallo-hydrolase [Gemmatimonadaceae bacterium]|nr:M20/M25/M40 family metallo-hydrolase [Gemmatimonadaceae bacterium]
MTDVVSLAAELLAIQSTTGTETAVVDYVSRWLVARGWNVTLQEVTRGRANIWASRSGSSKGVTFSTHLDTVPPFVPPRLEGTRLFGRGSSDAKGIVAAMLVAADRLVTSGEKSVEVLFVVGEEKGSDGARAANTLNARSRFLINGEPTESKLASGAKGSLRATIRTRGREAHSAYPHLGQSAIEPMLELLPTLKNLPLPTDPVLGQTTVNIGTIRGGTEANVIPAHAEAEIMFRLVSDVEPIKKMILDWAKGRADVEFGSHIPAQRFATVPGFQTVPVAYTSDIPLLSNWGEPLLFGPGSIHVAHTPDEYIEVDELRGSVDTYEKLARTLLAR